MERKLIVTAVAGLLILLAGTSKAEVICGKERPLKPVRCIRGKVIGPAGGPVSNVLVKVIQNGTDLATVKTAGDGHYLFGELKPGSYELAAQVDGLLPFRSRIVLANPAKKCRRELVIVLVTAYPDNCGSYVMKPKRLEPIRFPYCRSRLQDAGRTMQAKRGF